MASGQLTRFLLESASRPLRPEGSSPSEGAMNLAAAIISCTF